MAKSFRTSKKHSEESTKPCQPIFFALSMLSPGQPLNYTYKKPRQYIPEDDRNPAKQCAIAKSENSFRIWNLFERQVMLFSQFTPCLLYFWLLRPFG